MSVGLFEHLQNMGSTQKAFFSDAMPEKIGEAFESEMNRLFED